jgi:hypothetical protein
MRQFKAFFILLFFVALQSRAQDNIKILSRVIFIGDAGEIDQEQSEVINHAASQILPGKTSVVYLGDNIYPRGMGLPGSVEEQATKEILKSQYQPMRKNGAPVFFIPGNHDWDRSGPLGLEKIKSQAAFLAAQSDPLLRMIPNKGCPDPILITLNPGLVIVAFDSEWWLFPHNKNNPSGNCSCNTKAEVIAKMKMLAAQNKDKVVLLASHHPFKSYGIHSGRFPLIQHLFPLRAINKNLYIPLPLIGSFYPLWANLFPKREDLKHRDYKEMIQEVDAAFAGVSNLVHIAGHDHGLQFIRNKSSLQVVSGAGTKTSQVVKGKDAMYADAVQGYVVADYFTDKSIHFNYYAELDNGVVETFNFVKHYTAPKD